MITLTYDPYHNPAVPDGMAEYMAEGLIAMDHAQCPDHNLCVTMGNGLVIDALRVLVKKGQFPSDQLKIEYQGTIINVDDNGRMDSWPNGFHDYTEKLLCQL